MSKLYKKNKCGFTITTIVVLSVGCSGKFSTKTSKNNQRSDQPSIETPGTPQIPTDAVRYTATSSEETCEESIFGIVIYTAEDSSFYACTTSGWSKLVVQKGDKGDKGEKGDQGIQGPQGDTGTQGDEGPTGPEGPVNTAGLALKEPIISPAPDSSHLWQGDKSWMAVTGGNQYVGTNASGAFGVHSRTPPKGYISGAEVTFDTVNSTIVSSGVGECNGSSWEITSSVGHAVPAGDLTAGQWTYVYIDDSASAYPTPTLINSSVVPAFDGSRNGWYSGNDRAIGAVYSVDGTNLANTVGAGSEFRAPWLAVEVNGTPDGNWIASTTPVNSLTPVFAEAIKLYVRNTDTGSVTVEIQAPNTLDYIGIEGSDQTATTGWIVTGSNRNIQWRGEADDDASFSIYLLGYRIRR